MGISPISYNGKTYDPASISHDDALMIYKAFRKGEVDLEKSQEHYLANMMTEDDWDDIEYDTDISKADGKSQVKDAENAESHGDQTANAVSTSAPIFATLVLALVLDGFNQWFCALAANAVGLAGVVMSQLYDNGYKDRTQANDNADGTNEIIDAHAAAMEDTMDMMNEDMELYQEQNDEMTNGMNEKAAQLADLKQQLADCEAAGDAAGASGIKNQMKKINEEDFAEDQEGLDETKEKLEGYQEANGEALGVADGGTKVSEFLKDGTWLGVPAAVNALFYTIGAGLAGAAAAGCVPKLAPFFPDAISSGLAKVLLGVAAGLMGMAAYTFGDKAKKEFECGSTGSDMQGHVSTLNDMIVQQQQYIETTTEDYDESDEKAGEDREKGQEAADKLAPGGSKNPNGTDKDKDKDDDKNGNSQPSVVM